MPFIPNRIYNRRADIHANYGGQQQGGIVTPQGHPMIFLFTGQGGAANGYDDGYTDDGLFEYFGEGQVGDMQFLRGNAAIQNHAMSGKSLHLFTSLGGGQARYQGEFALAFFDWREAPDRKGNPRQAVVFTLAPVIADEEFEVDADPEPNLTLEARRQRALEAADAPQIDQSAADRNQIYRRRSAQVRDYVLARANGECERCHKPAPFLRGRDGTPYLEPHHIRRLADGGLDHPDWVAALCASCHREAHYGKDHALINRDLRQYILEGLD